MPLLTSPLRLAFEPLVGAAGPQAAITVGRSLPQSAGPGILEAERIRVGPAAAGRRRLAVAGGGLDSNAGAHRRRRSAAAISAAAVAVRGTLLPNAAAVGWRRAPGSRPSGATAGPASLGVLGPG